MRNPSAVHSAVEDPFYDEARLHGKDDARPFDNLLRDRCREWAADGCDRCVKLMEEWDREFARWFLG